MNCRMNTESTHTSNESVLIRLFDLFLSVVSVQGLVSAYAERYPSPA
jgi:hypothetical protein